MHTRHYQQNPSFEKTQPLHHFFHKKTLLNIIITNLLIDLVPNLHLFFHMQMISFYSQIYNNKALESPKFIKTKIKTNKKNHLLEFTYERQNSH